METTYYIMNVVHQICHIVTGKKLRPYGQQLDKDLSRFLMERVVQCRFNQENSFEKDERDDDTGSDDVNHFSHLFVNDYDRRIYKT